MNKIEFPRVGVDGIKRTESYIQNWFIGKIDAGKVDPISSIIKKNIETIQDKNYDAKSLLKEIRKKIDDSEENDLLKNIDYFLLLTPDKLLKCTKIIDNDFPQVFSATDSGFTKATEFGNQVIEAFNYNGYRQNKLIDLAKMLNVKCCPYCNMHYTLYAEKGGKRQDQLTKFQFDHFYAKSKYPMLSMSLYNLIPSCAVCNQGKSATNLSLDFHPYHSNICNQFTFNVHNPIGLFSGDRINDEIEIDILSNNIDKKDVDVFINTFHLKTLYQRHGDIAQETFDKAYEKEYYQHPLNFNWLSNASPEYIQRLWMGVYPNEKDIEKRPMSKFIQDLWKQARNIKSEISIDETCE